MPKYVQRRDFVSGLALTQAAPAALAQADDDGKYPQGAVKFIVPLAPGGVADVMSRMIAEHLQSKWGQHAVFNTDKISAKTIPELIAYLKANPGKVSYGSSGMCPTKARPRCSTI